MNPRINTVKESPQFEIFSRVALFVLFGWLHFCGGISTVRSNVESILLENGEDNHLPTHQDILNGFFNVFYVQPEMIRFDDPQRDKNLQHYPLRMVEMLFWWKIKGNQIEQYFI